MGLIWYAGAALWGVAEATLIVTEDDAWLSTLRRVGHGDVDEKAEADERQSMVTAAINKLPVRQRDAIMLTYSEGMSNAEVAEILGTSVSAVETLLVRGKQNLRRTLGDLIDKDE